MASRMPFFHLRDWIESSVFQSALRTPGGQLRNFTCGAFRLSTITYAVEGDASESAHQMAGLMATFNQRLSKSWGLIGSSISRARLFQIQAGRLVEAVYLSVFARSAHSAVQPVGACSTNLLSRGRRVAYTALRKWEATHALPQHNISTREIHPHGKKGKERESLSVSGWDRTTRATLPRRGPSSTKTVCGCACAFLRGLRSGTR
jgi:hypothetical protein